MNFNESFSVSIQGLSTHKLRTFLTMLGIIFGVAAVIAMLSIGAGAKQEAMDQIKLLGMNNVIIRSSPVQSEEDEYGTVIEGRGLTMEDARSLNILNPLVESSVPQKEIPDIRISRKSEQTTGNIVGTQPRLRDALNLDPAYGNFFNYEDVHEARRVCVLGYQIKRDLFHYEEAVGQQIKIGDLWFTVAGTMGPMPRSTGKGGVGDRDLNLDVYIPLSTAIYRFNIDPAEPEVDQIILRVLDEDRIREAANLADNLLDIRHNGMRDYRIIVPEELMRQSQQTQRIFNIVMGAIAGISLLVGGIGIMNIMLASILERTREIGVRRAMGATRKDILGQFLIEAVLLSFSGGLIGILLGFIMTKIISSYAQWKTIVDFSSIILAFGVSATVGILFGIYPARKAAMLDPIESLRYE
ncbi:MAG TPA: FtsX-like permease family protein [bacterium]|nr:FtsX-like permease family protein [bacterium]